jgi:hypothetical protein
LRPTAEFDRSWATSDAADTARERLTDIWSRFIVAEGPDFEIAPATVGPSHCTRC